MICNLNMNVSVSRQLADPDRHQPKGCGTIYPSSESRTNLYKAVSDTGISDLLDPKKYHITLMYDRANPTFDVPYINEWHNARVIGAELFGPNSDTLVLTLDSKTITRRHDYLKRLGYRHSYPDYRPHITVKLGASVDDLNKLRSAINTGAFDDNYEFGKEDWEHADN